MAGTIYNEADVTRTLINKASGTNHELVAAVAGKKIALIKCILTCDSEVGIEFNSDTTALTGEILAKSLVLDIDEIPWVVTAAGEALDVDLSSAATLDGIVYTIQI